MMEKEETNEEKVERFTQLEARFNRLSQEIHDLSGINSLLTLGVLEGNSTIIRANIVHSLKWPDINPDGKK
jgi:hypothetical protein